MSMHFIGRITTYVPKNRKQAEAIDLVAPFEYMLITSDEDLTAFKLDLKNKIDALNKKYPKVKKIILKFPNNVGQIYCEHDSSEDYSVAFTMEVNQVHREYAKEGGQNEI